MRTTIDSAGRIVIPKALRDELGLTDGQELEIVGREGRIELEVPATPMKLERRGPISVAVPERTLPQLTTDLVRDTLERTRR
jgi:AbrB family looped-hinge helix DNA binding protein